MDVTAAERTENGSAGTMRVAGRVRLLAVAVALAALVHDALAAWQQTTLWPADFASYYVPARAVISAPNTNVYDYSNLLTINAAHGYAPGIFYPFIYPPVALLLLRPLAMLSFGHANLVWIAVSHLCAIATAWLLADAFVLYARARAGEAGGSDRVVRFLEATALRVGRRAFPTVPFAAAAFVLLVAWPAWDTYYWGQINFVIAFLLALAANAHLRGKHALAGLAVALAGGLKLTPLFFAAYFLLRGAWKSVLWAVGGFVVLAALPLAFFPFENYQHLAVELKLIDQMFVLGNHNESFIAVFPHTLAIFGHGGARAQSLAELVGQTVGAALAFVTLACVGLSSVARPIVRGPMPAVADVRGWAALVRGLRARADGTATWLGLAATLLVYMLVTPLVWSHFYVVVLPALLLVLGHVAIELATGTDAANRRLARTAGVVTGIALAVLMCELPGGADRGLQAVTNSTTLALLNVRPLSVLLVWGATMALLVRRLRGGTVRKDDEPAPAAAIAIGA